MRLGFILYYDDLEVVNPLGAFHGRHKLGLFYWALLNLDASSRMSFKNLHLMTVAMVSDIDYYGINQVVSGLSGDTSFGSAMTALDQGLHIRLPHGSSSSTVLVRGWCVCLSADFPAAALCAGFKQSASADSFCRECCVQQHRNEVVDYTYPCPASFLDTGNPNLECPFDLRTQQNLAAHQLHLQTLQSNKARKDFLASIGVNSFTGHAFTRVPHFDICRYIPFDFMHVELEGNLKNELAAMLYMFLRQRPTWGFTLEKLNARIKSYAWPGGFKPPTFTSGYLEKGTQEGLPKTGCHVHMTAGDMMVFARHSIELMMPLIKLTSDPVWKCWVTHIQYFQLLLKHQLTFAQVVELDKLIYKHHEQFLQVYTPRHACSMQFCAFFFAQFCAFLLVSAHFCSFLRVPANFAGVRSEDVQTQESLREPLSIRHPNSRASKALLVHALRSAQPAFQIVCSTWQFYRNLRPVR